MVKIKVVMRLSAKFQESRIASYFSNKATVFILYRQ